ncbi:AAA family ATPase [Pseudomonas alliivorans]|nr:AAA family ATPase [Pseudomonas alliivorans]
MLKRISKIQNVGRFRNCTSGRVEFNKIAIMFGLNTYGKSTLSDIFTSLKAGHSGPIKKRLSIPLDQADQEVALSFQEEGQREVAVIYKNGNWQAQLPASLRLHVFDDGFYHENLFAARAFTRQTKEQFSSFVLGAEGVEKANLIAEKNKAKGEALRARNKLTKDAFSDVADIHKFIALKVNEGKDQLEINRDQLRDEWSSISKQKKQIEQILARETLKPLRNDNTLSVSFDALNDALVRTHEGVHEEAKKAVSHHIEKCFKEVQGAEAWIRQGLNQAQGEECLFCGQTLGDSANNLMDFYRLSFDAGFRSHQESVSRMLDLNGGKINSFELSGIRLLIEQNAKVRLSYPELAEQSLFQQYSEAVRQEEEGLNSIVDGWVEGYARTLSSVNSLIEQKKAAPQLAFEMVDFGDWKETLESLGSAVERYNSSTKLVHEVIRQFRDGLSHESLSEKLTKLKASGDDVNLKIKRLERVVQCDEWLRLNKEDSDLGEEIPKLLEQLRREQSDFIDSFFDRVDKCFVDFGSKDFKLVKGIDNRGNTPIYFLKVLFKNNLIAESNIDRVFSESDRRALALSVFWASLIGQTDAELAGSIVVFDDPVTSFDSNRVGSVHRGIINLATEVRQVIVLSHYEQGVADLLVKHKKNKPLSFCMIENVGSESSICTADIEDFIKTDHQKKRDEIFRFIEAIAPGCGSGDLRVFLEYELDHRFAKQMSQYKLGILPLGERIDGLFDHGCVSSDVKDALHAWREDLNPAHHLWTGNNIEDQREAASRFMTFVYHGLKGL